MCKSATAKRSSEKSGSTFFFGKKIQELSDTAKEKVKGVIDECVDYYEVFIAIAQNYVDNYPGKEQVEDRLDRIMKNVASKINFLTGEDVEKLSVSIDRLNRKLETMLKK